MGEEAPATRVVLRPLVTPLPLGFPALAFATTVLAALGERTVLPFVLPLGRRDAGQSALAGRGPLDPADLAEEARVRPQL